MNILKLLLLLSTTTALSLARTLLADDTDSDNATDVEIYDFPSCQIYCYGRLLHTVQMAKLESDSKTFVDRKLKYTPEKTNEDFEIFMTAKNDEPSKSEIAQFVEEHFDGKGTELETWEPEDWKEHPSFLDQINDPDLRQWGSDLNAIWKELGRKMNEDVAKNPQYYSIIPVPNPVIVPGGRFIEFYYWDSYWIIRGLLYSQMEATARGMIENFLSIVQRIGFIPNGGRVYYSGRSQPPLLSGMVKSYVDFTRDKQFGVNALGVLEHEFEYFVNNHTVQAKGHDLFAYRDSSCGPRPESYSEDIETAEIFPTDQQKQDHWAELKAAAESGMDFSSRWFINENGTNEGNLMNTNTRSIVPVDLNAIMYWNAIIIAEFNRIAGKKDKAEEYEAKAEKILQGITEVLWNEEAGVWLDYDMINNKPRNYFVASNFAPLWTGAYNKAEADRISCKVLEYIERNKLDSFPGGVPNTLQQTGEQWDFPNVWPPMQYIIVEGLDNLNTTKSKELSDRWGERWVKSNFKAYSETRKMFEKYNAEKFGGHGGGGEYEVQTGFGWSNGVIIEWLAKYGQRDTMGRAPGKHVTSLASVAVIALIATFIGGFMW